MRGNLHVPFVRIDPLGTIPACAGEPHLPLTVQTRVRDYPRVCGGTRRKADGRESRQGLSPRVRGNPLFILTGDLAGGTIPACAGEPTNIVG